MPPIANNPIDYKGPPSGQIGINGAREGVPNPDMSQVMIPPPSSLEAPVANGIDYQVGDMVGAGGGTEMPMNYGDPGPITTAEEYSAMDIPTKRDYANIADTMPTGSYIPNAEDLNIIRANEIRDISGSFPSSDPNRYPVATGQRSGTVSSQPVEQTPTGNLFQRYYANQQRIRLPQRGDADFIRER